MSRSGQRFLLGCGAGFSGDRLDVAKPVVETLIARSAPCALMFETLGERTLALAQQARDRSPDRGYEPHLEALLAPVLSACIEHRIAIIGNFGAANPQAAADCIGVLCRRLGLPPVRVAVVEGDDVRATLDLDALEMSETDAVIDLATDKLIAANVYLGAGPIVDALRQGAQIVVTGRVADPALALAPLIHHFDWAFDDWARLAAGTLVGHLLECGGQVTGGYFADPGAKDVPNLAELGFPLAEVGPDGDAVIFKADDTGGLVSERTVKEQLLYEVHDPRSYLTPDVILDLSSVELVDLGADRVAVSGARGRARPATLKTTLSTRGGWLAEGEISYAGPNALARAKLAAQILRERLQRRQPDLPLRIELIGLLSVFDGDSGELAAAAVTDDRTDLSADIRLRMAAQHERARIAESAAREVLALYCNGPAAGGGVRWRVTPRIKTASVLIPRESVRPVVTVAEY